MASTRVDCDGVVHLFACVLSTASPTVVVVVVVDDVVAVGHILSVIVVAAAADKASGSFGVAADKTR